MLTVALRVRLRKDADRPNEYPVDRSPRKQWNPSPPWDPLLPGIFFAPVILAPVILAPVNRRATNACNARSLCREASAIPRVTCVVRYFEDADFKASK
jgi:hypothetical protein